MARKNAPDMQNVEDRELPIKNVGVPTDFGVSYKVQLVASPVQLREALSQHLTVKEKEERDNLPGVLESPAKGNF